MTVISTAKAIAAITTFVENAAWGEQIKITVISHEDSGWSFEVIKLSSSFATRFDNDMDITTHDTENEEEVIEAMTRIANAAQIELENYNDKNEEDNA
jgi:hypothetical protein